MCQSPGHFASSCPHHEMRATVNDAIGFGVFNR
ncbi:hypothetical protein FSB75_17745 [Flavisolibacter ginsenosidimutans]|uniref:Uncharacterized protein n=1 Tax=Flavisolibacter ginsenosidimutans TaxID=661481 RepID=A0A5B8UPP9_9BACT|nr:hypothetical protein FSB75_17745 [Flavisolibacter ginsenosidimutans]